MRLKVPVEVTLSEGSQVLFHWRGRMTGSKALMHALAKAQPMQDPVQTWAGQTKRRKR